MINTSSRTNLSQNRKTYQRLKAALKLNLRRQVFIGVCDNFVLRDRLAAQLQHDLQYSGHPPIPAHLRPSDEHLVSLYLDINKPDPISGIIQWLRQHQHKRDQGRLSLPMPAFQLLGVEHLSRQPAAIQWLFLNYLQGIERSLPALDSSLLIWVPRPWARIIPHSAPDFWRCRTAVFEFEGEPTPLTFTMVPEPSYSYATHGEWSAHQWSNPDVDSDVAVISEMTRAIAPDIISEDSSGDNIDSDTATDGTPPRTIEPDRAIGPRNRPSSALADEVNADEVNNISADVDPITDVDAADIDPVTNVDAAKSDPVTDVVDPNVPVGNGADSSIAVDDRADVDGAAIDAAVQDGANIPVKPDIPAIAAAIDEVIVDDGVTITMDADINVVITEDVDGVDVDGVNIAVDVVDLTTDNNDGDAVNINAVDPSLALGPTPSLPLDSETALICDAGPISAIATFFSATPQTPTPPYALTAPNAQPSELSPPPPNREKRLNPSVDPETSVTNSGDKTPPGTSQPDLTEDAVAADFAGDLVDESEVINVGDLVKGLESPDEETPPSITVVENDTVADELDISQAIASDVTDAQTSDSISTDGIKVADANDSLLVPDLVVTSPSPTAQSLAHLTDSEADWAGFNPDDPEIRPLLQQIADLEHQQTELVVMAEAYRHLGNVYRDRIEQGDLSPQNLICAMRAYRQVLHCIDATHPAWAEVLNDLGNLCWLLSRGAPSLEQGIPHLQQGITSYRMALSGITPQSHPDLYPMIQNNLGAAYGDLARYQAPVENLQHSIHAYQEALLYRSVERNPLRYGSTQNNLGTTYWNLAQHVEPLKNLQNAIAAYSEALRMYRPDTDPVNYAMVQNNLGTTYWNLSQHEQSGDWLRLAIMAYETALCYRTMEANPGAFAATQNNLGTAYWHLATYVEENPVPKLVSLQKAIRAYEVAIASVGYLQQSHYPSPLNFDILATHNNLGLVQYQIATEAELASVHEDPNHNSEYLNAALDHHLLALQGWRDRPELRQTALGCVIQTLQALYNQNGLTGQNLALSKVPGYLLPEIMPKL